MHLLDGFTKSDKEIIEEIHSSFDNAQEELLQQAMKIINDTKSNLSSKAERLEAIGFTASELVKRNKANKGTILESSNDAELVNYYKQNYPFQKFLKVSQLEEICKKYNLIFAPISSYKEDVPDKNLSEIENSKVLLRSDEAKDYEWCEISTHSYILPGSPFLSIFDKAFYLIDRKVEDKNFNFYSDADKYLKKKYNINSSKYLVDTVRNFKENRQGLFIAAPKSHFDLKGLQNKGLGFLSVSITEVKDPIVFRYVRGGIQVLSKWGLEAEDEMLQNEILN